MRIGDSTATWSPGTVNLRTERPDAHLWVARDMSAPNVSDARSPTAYMTHYEYAQKQPIRRSAHLTNSGMQTNFAVRSATESFFSRASALAIRMHPAMAWATDIGSIRTHSTRTPTLDPRLKTGTTLHPAMRIAKPALRVVKKLPFGKVAALMLMANEVGLGSDIPPKAQKKISPERPLNPETLLKEARAEGMGVHLQTYPPPRGVTIEIVPDDADKRPTIHAGGVLPAILTRPLDGRQSIATDVSWDVHVGSSTLLRPDAQRGVAAHPPRTTDFFHLSEQHPPSPPRKHELSFTDVAISASEGWVTSGGNTRPAEN